MTSRILTNRNPFMSLMQEDLATKAMVRVKEGIQVRMRTNTGNNSLGHRKTLTTVLENQLAQAIEGVKGMRHQIEECHYRK